MYILKHLTVVIIMTLKYIVLDESLINLFIICISMQTKHLIFLNIMS